MVFSIAQEAPITPVNLGSSRDSAILWLSVILVVAVLGFALIMLLRRWLKEPLVSGGSDTGFSLSELRAMRDRGEITPEEYEQTRAKVIAKVKQAADRKGTDPSLE